MSASPSSPAPSVQQAIEPVGRKTRKRPATDIWAQLNPVVTRVRRKHPRRRFCGQFNPAVCEAMYYVLEPIATRAAEITKARALRRRNKPKKPQITLAAMRAALHSGFLDSPVELKNMLAAACPGLF